MSAQASMTEYVDATDGDDEQSTLFEWAINSGDSPDEASHEAVYWRYNLRNPATGRFIRACDLTY